MSLRNVLGLDVGGANLKAAHANGAARVRPFALWKQPDQLAAQLKSLLQELPAFDALAVTLTAEICDCFASKREGVNHVLDAVAAAAPGARLRVWTNEGKLVSVSRAREQSLRAAAANWLALATFAGRYCPLGAALLLDVGSTTTDITPLVEGRPKPLGRTDLERLAARELVYTGVARTPVCALLQEASWRTHRFAPAAELFATTRDAYLLLGHTPEAPEDANTADGRPATRAFAHARMARMFCADADMLTAGETLELARQVRSAQMKLLHEALSAVVARMPVPPASVVLAGSGEFLGRQLLAEAIPSANVLSLSERLGPEASAAACAYALTTLAAEGRGE